MIEALEVRDLPYVEDGDPRASRQLVEPLIAFIDGDLPGVGIRHTDDSLPTHKSMHLWHRSLVLLALRHMEPPVKYGRFPKIMDRPYEMDGPAEPHTDDFADRLLEEAVLDSISMTLRLHTADPYQGAQVTLANTGPGYYGFNGDYRGFGEQGKPRLSRSDIWGCYDPGRTAIEPSKLAAEQIASRHPQQRTAVNEPVIYVFDQQPSSSVLFRTKAHLGPVSIHSVDAPEECNRFVHVSDLTIHSTPV